MLYFLKALLQCLLSNQIICSNAPAVKMYLIINNGEDVRHFQAETAGINGGTEDGKTQECMVRKEPRKEEGDHV